MDNPDTIPPADAARPSRRGILAALGLAGVASAAGLAPRAARAQEADTSVPDTAPEPTPYGATDSVPAEPMPINAPTSDPPLVISPGPSESTTPPKKPQPADLPLIAAAKTLELTAHSVFSSAVARLDALDLDDARKALVIAMHEHHLAYAEALSALYGPGSPSDPNPSLAVAVNSSAFSTGDAAALLAAASDLEHAAADTHQTLLGLLQSTDAAALVASIQHAEARHAATLAFLISGTYGADQPAIEDAAAALSFETITGGN